MEGAEDVDVVVEVAETSEVIDVVEVDSAVGSVEATAGATAGLEEDLGTGIAMEVDAAEGSGEVDPVQEVGVASEEDLVAGVILTAMAVVSAVTDPAAEAMIIAVHPRGSKWPIKTKQKQHQI